MAEGRTLVQGRVLMGRDDLEQGGIQVQGRIQAKEETQVQGRIQVQEGALVQGKTLVQKGSLP